MFIPECRFCDHTNPAAAKFCNECGSPLHLKSCSQCEAINDRGAKTCYNCGSPDPALVIAPDVDVEEPAGETVDTMPAGVSHASPKRRPQSRVATAVLPTVVLLSALAVSAYYAYRNPVQLREWLSATWATVSPSGGDTPMTPVRGTSSVPAPSAPTGSVGAASVAAIGPAVRSPANEPATDTTISPVRQDSVPATGAAAVDGQTPTSNQTLAPVASQPQVSTREQAISTPLAPHVEKKSSTDGKTTAKKSKKTSTKKPPPAQATLSSKAPTTIETPNTASGK